MSDPVIHLKQELLAAAERQQRHTVLAPKSGRWWLERFRFVPRRRRRLVVVLAALAVATAAATGGWAIVHEVVLHKGFVGLPPVGATPSAPESGELVIQYRVDTEDLEPANGARGWVYADGRLITLRHKSDLPEAANRWSSGFLEQRLTPEGVELLRSEIVSTGLFEHHQPARFDDSPHNVIQVRIGDRLVRAQASFPKGLRERLANPESWLPASAWANRQIRAYVASKYAVSYGGQLQTIERSRLLPLLPIPAADLLSAQDAVPLRGFIGGGGYPRISTTSYVSDLTTDEARALAQALDDAGLEEHTPADQLAYSFEIPGTSVDPPLPEKGPVRNRVFIAFEPYLPHGEWECAPCG
ncbi:MAG TPA: hypothetical protein VFT86_01910 [Gaiellaceae bacterium]|nr:hypothetical protein [Gaiellaceae bacterium]